MLHLGILVDSTHKQQSLTQLVAQSGHTVGCHLLLSAHEAANQQLVTQEMDAWVVDVAEDYCDDEHLLEQLFAQSRVPIILSDSSEFAPGSEEHSAWLRRTGLRLQRLRGDINLQQADPANELWVLAASTGGPAAVKRFLAQLPANLGIAFLYVQHIDAKQAVTLNRMMSNAGSYPAMVATQGVVLEANSLTLVTARDSVEILENGTLVVNYGQSWKGSYAPSIDQLAANAARIYRERCGLIIFTGMGDDGAASCRLIKQLGGKAWVQSPDDCTSDSMPVSALATGCVHLSGTPEYLARSLAQLKR
jgi:chemosensory pili system protein ChpB (putative protein-glutamate methylesterase)